MVAVTGVLDCDSLGVEEGVSCALAEAFSTPIMHNIWLKTEPCVKDGFVCYHLLHHVWKRHFQVG